MQSIMKNIAPPYDNSPCTKGEYRVVDDKIYLCKEDTSGVFDISKWEQVFLTDFIRGQLNENVESNLSGKATLLWTNSSLTSNFSAQKISIDLTNYSHIIVVCYINCNLGICANALIEKNNVNTYTGIGGVGGADNGMARRITSIDNTGITFGNTYMNQTIKNDCIIPYKIYGINITYK